VVGDRHHQTHVVLDQEHGHVALVPDPADQVAEHVDFSWLRPPAVRRAPGFLERAAAHGPVRRASGAEGEAGHHGVGHALEDRDRPGSHAPSCCVGLAAAEPRARRSESEMMSLEVRAGCRRETCRSPKGWEKVYVLEGGGRCRSRRSGAAARQDAGAFHQDVGRRTLVETGRGS